MENKKVVGWHRLLKTVCMGPINSGKQKKNEKFQSYQQQTNLSIGAIQATLAFQLCEQLINTP